MSHAATTWAYSQPIKRATRKFVLVALADHADAHGRCYPSIPALEAKTGLDRKTIMAALDALENTGFLCDTGERVGATRQVKVYRLNSFSDEAHYAAPRPAKQSRPQNRTAKSTENETANRADFGTVAPIANDTENGTVKEYQERDSTENGTVPFFPANSTVFPGEQYRFSEVTVPKTVQGTVREPSVEPSVEPSDDNAARKSIKSIPTKTTNGTTPKGTRLPDIWEPDANAVLAMESECGDLDISAATREFADYWRAVPNPKGLKTDWLATWRNDMREKNRRGTFRRSRGNQPALPYSPQSHPKPSGATLADLADRNAARRAARSGGGFIANQPTLPVVIGETF